MTTANIVLTRQQMIALAVALESYDPGVRPWIGNEHVRLPGRHEMRGIADQLTRLANVESVRVGFAAKCEDE